MELWSAQQDLNLQSSESESDALSSYAMDGYNLIIISKKLKVKQK